MRRSMAIGCQALRAALRARATVFRSRGAAWRACFGSDHVQYQPSHIQRHLFHFSASSPTFGSSSCRGTGRGGVGRDVVGPGPVFGIAFDIDGVLLRGNEPIPAARRALERLSMLSSQASGMPHVPYVFLTNGGGVPERVKAAQLADTFGLPIGEEHVVLGHTPFRDLFLEKYRNERVLVLGKGHPKRIMTEYGFRKVVSVEEFVQENPFIDPLSPPPPPSPMGQNTPPAADSGSVSAMQHPVDERHVAKHAEKVVSGGGRTSGGGEGSSDEHCSRNGQLTLDDERRRIRGVFVVSDPTDWGRDLQVICDVLQTDGLPGLADVDPCSGLPVRQVPIYLAADDFVYQGRFAIPRFGMGAFRVALQVLYERLTGRRLEYESFGKPHRVAMVAAERSILRQHLRHQDGSPFPRSVHDHDDQDLAGLKKEDVKGCVMTPLMVGDHGVRECSDGGGREREDRREEVLGASYHVETRSSDRLTLYMIGDNPSTDIRGANQAGPRWFSILIRSGCHKHNNFSGRDPDVPAEQGCQQTHDYIYDDDHGRRHPNHCDRPDKIVEDVDEAMQFIFEREGITFDNH